MARMASPPSALKSAQRNNLNLRCRMRAVASLWRRRILRSLRPTRTRRGREGTVRPFGDDERERALPQLPQRARVHPDEPSPLHVDVPGPAGTGGAGAVHDRRRPRRAQHLYTSGELQLSRDELGRYLRGDWREMYYGKK